MTATYLIGTTSITCSINGHKEENSQSLKDALKGWLFFYSSYCQIVKNTL